MEYLIIGKIIATHGIKGEVKIAPLTDNLDRFEHLNKLYIGENKLEVRYESSKIHKNHIILKFEEFNNINEVLKFKDLDLFISFEDRRELNDDEFFIFDLIGLKGYCNNQYIGELIDVIESLANDVYVFKSENGHEILVPAVKEFILDVDLKSGKILLNLIEGMIE